MFSPDLLPSTASWSSPVGAISRPLDSFFCPKKNLIYLTIFRQVSTHTQNNGPITCQNFGEGEPKIPPISDCLSLQPL